MAVVAVVLFLALLVARRGTPNARAAAGVSLAVLALAGFAGYWRERRTWKDPKKTIHRLAIRADRAIAARAVRALALVAEPPSPGTSEVLVKLHAERCVRALPRDRIVDRAATLARRYARVAVLIACVSVALVATRGWSLLEGGDVLLARGQRAPLPMLWLEPLEIEARPPEYLHEYQRTLGAYAPVALPRGTLLTVRGTPTHPGRRLTLTDGTHEVPFVDDGAGHSVARWPLGESVALQVVARFGQIAIGEAEATAITSIADELPVVRLEGAPREIRVADVGAGATIPIRYEATDDHGLREVHLVLRSGAREERRVLARLDGETETSRGGHMVDADDPFIKKSHVPVEITVEAKDNDPVTGPKWGASAAIVVIPPEAGEPEALRMAELRRLRDRVTDSLDARLERVFHGPLADRAVLAEADGRGVAEDRRAIDSLAKASFAGVGVSPRILAILDGQMRRVREAMTRESRSPGVASHADLVKATERLVLVTDAIVRGLGRKDAHAVARELADVAEDLSLGLSLLEKRDEVPRNEMRVAGSTEVLTGGGRSLMQLGTLGRDLGEIVHNDLLRVARAQTQRDLVHAEIAASDLAARLKDPEPSFGSRGSSGGRAGGEAGGAPGGGGGDSSGADDAQRAFEEAAREVERLAEEHAEQVGKVDQALTEPESPEDAKALSEEGKNHAKAVREATSQLPSVGAGSDSWTNKGAAAREHAETMARALEDGNPADAVASGHSALDALDEAKRIAARERWTSFSQSDDEPGRRSADERLESARQKLEPEVKWAEEKQRAMRKRAAERKSAELSRDGDEEGRVADKAGALRQRGQGQALPEAALDALHDAEQAANEAARALKQGDIDRGMQRQREAQRQFDLAKRALGSESGDDPTSGGEGRQVHAGHADIPTADAHKGPEEFRRRVIQGLGQTADGRHREAIRRYADGLLQ